MTRNTAGSRRPRKQGRENDRLERGADQAQRTGRGQRPIGGGTGGATPRSGRPPAGALRSAAPSAGAASAADLLAVYRPDIADLLAEGEVPAFRHPQILEHLLLRPGQTFADATNLPLELRSSLEGLGSSTLKPADSVSSADGATKLLLVTADDLAIETVIMRYRDRVTACVSSQVGCAVGCAFCATGTMGLTRNLNPAEIVDQVRAVSAILAEEDRRLSNIVYMGMGEPLHNLTSVLRSIRILTDPKGMNMARRALSVSTIGIPSGIRRLALEEPQVNLAISLHAADERTRAHLVPERSRHSIADILEAAWEHFAVTKRKLLVEYVLVSGVNDSRDQARRLAGLLRGHVVSVNLLAWNPVADRGMKEAGFRTPSPEDVAAFRKVLQSMGIDAVVRQSKGATIGAACGQLAGRRRRKSSGQSVA